MKIPDFLSCVVFLSNWDFERYAPYSIEQNTLASLLRTAEMLMHDNRAAYRAFEIIATQQKDSFAAKIAKMFIGYSYAEADKLESGIAIWRKALNAYSLPMIYDALKKHLRRYDDRLWFICMQLAVNLIADDAVYRTSDNRLRRTDDSDIHLRSRVVERWCRSRNQLHALADEETAHRFVTHGVLWTRKLIPDGKTVLNRYATDLKRKNQLSEAMDTYQSVLAIYPENNEAYYNLGKISYLLRDTNGAVKNYLRALHLEIIQVMIQSGASVFFPHPEQLLHLPREQIISLMTGDPNTCIHLGRAIIDLTDYVRKSQPYQKNMQDYYEGLLGHGGGGINAAFGEAFFAVGAEFALDNLEWQRMNDTNVTDLYEGTKRMSFEVLRKLDSI